MPRSCLRPTKQCFSFPSREVKKEMTGQMERPRNQQPPKRNQELAARWHNQRNCQYSKGLQIEDVELEEMGAKWRKPQSRFENMPPMFVRPLPGRCCPAPREMRIPFRSSLPALSPM